MSKKTKQISSFDLHRILGNFDENDRPIQDEVVRTNIKVISSRLCDLRERFLKVIQKINRDAAFFDRNLSDEEDEDEDEKSRPSDEEMSIDQSETGIFIFVLIFYIEILFVEICRVTKKITNRLFSHQKKNKRCSKKFLKEKFVNTLISNI